MFMQRLVCQKWTEGRRGGLGLPLAIRELIFYIILCLVGCQMLLKSMLKDEAFGSGITGDQVKKMVKYCSQKMASNPKPFLLINKEDEVEVPFPHSEPVLLPRFILNFNAIVSPAMPHLRFSLCAVPAESDPAPEYHQQLLEAYEFTPDHLGGKNIAEFVPVADAGLADLVQYREENPAPAPAPPPPAPAAPVVGAYFNSTAPAPAGPAATASAPAPSPMVPGWVKIGNANPEEGDSSGCHGIDYRPPPRNITINGGTQAGDAERQARLARLDPGAGAGAGACVQAGVEVEEQEEAGAEAKAGEESEEVKRGKLVGKRIRRSHVIESDSDSGGDGDADAATAATVIAQTATAAPPQHLLIQIATAAAAGTLCKTAMAESACAAVGAEDGGDWVAGIVDQQQHAAQQVAAEALELLVGGDAVAPSPTLEGLDLYDVVVFVRDPVPTVRKAAILFARACDSIMDYYRLCGSRLGCTEDDIGELVGWDEDTVRQRARPVPTSEELAAYVASTPTSTDDAWCLSKSGWVCAWMVALPLDVNMLRAVEEDVLPLLGHCDSMVRMEGHWVIARMLANRWLGDFALLSASNTQAQSSRPTVRTVMPDEEWRHLRAQWAGANNYAIAARQLLVDHTNGNIMLRREIYEVVTDALSFIAKPGSWLIAIDYEEIAYLTEDDFDFDDSEDDDDANTWCKVCSDEYYSKSGSTDTCPGCRDGTTPKRVKGQQLCAGVLVLDS